MLNKKQFFHFKKAGPLIKMSMMEVNWNVLSQNSISAILTNELTDRSQITTKIIPRYKYCCLKNENDSEKM